MVDPNSIDYYVNDLIEKEFVKWFNSNYSEIDDSKINIGISIYSDHI